MSSSSSSDGSVELTLTFASNTNPDIAQVQVQNRLQAVVPLLPQIVQQQGITVNKSSIRIPDGDRLLLGGPLAHRKRHGRFRHDQGRQSDLAGCRASAGCSSSAPRMPCASGSTPTSCAPIRLTPSDVVAAVRAQNAQFSVGQLGGTPQVADQQLNATDHGARPAADRRGVRQRHRARRGQRRGAAAARRGARRTRRRRLRVSRVVYNRRPPTGFAVSLATGANALATAERVKARIARAAAAAFPRPQAISSRSTPRPSCASRFTRWSRR